jgi:hypothetical protein
MNAGNATSQNRSNKAQLNITRSPEARSTLVTRVQKLSMVFTPLSPRKGLFGDLMCSKVPNLKRVFLIHRFSRAHKRESLSTGLLMRQGDFPRPL